MDKIITLDKILEDISARDYVPSLLLHSCCAPCSSYVLEYLSEYFRITVLYYNPNIFPGTEYEYRIAEQKRLISSFNMKSGQEKKAYNIEFIGTDHMPEVYYDAVRGLENEPERGKRCDVCFRLRLEYAAGVAKEKGFDFFTTTLSISPMKNADRLNSIGGEMGEKYGVRYLYSDFKKKNGYGRSIELSKEYGLYRQNYCGCEYSYMQRKESDAIENR